jgi:O-antigen/teichoic acid export membrane protein
MMDKDNILKKTLSGFAWEGSTKILIQAVTWVTTVLVARILSPEDYGVVAISGVFTGALVLITNLGLMSSLINMKEVDQEDYDSVFWLNIIFSILLYTFIYAMAPFIASFYGSEQLVDVIRLSGIIMPLHGLMIVPIAIAMRNMDYKYRAIVDSLGQFVTAISAVALAYNGYGVWTLVVSVLIGQAVVVCAYFPLMNGIPRFSIKIDRIMKIAPFGLYVTGSDVLAFFTRSAGVMIIGLFLSERIVGLYSMAWHLSTMPMDKVGSIFNRIAFPAISRSRDNASFAGKLFINMHKYLLVVTYPVFIGFALLAEDIVILLLTDKWVQIAPIIQALCILNMLRISGMVMPPVLTGLGLARWMFKYNVISSFVMPIVFIVGVQFGLEGILAAWFIAFPVLYIYMLTILLPKLELSPLGFLDTFRTPIICSGIMALLLLFITPYFDMENRIIELVITVALGMFFYVLSYYLLFKKELTALLARVKLIRNGAFAEADK